jgi:hypothetical protein
MYDRGEILTVEERRNILQFIYADGFMCSSITGNRADFKFDVTTKVPGEVWKIKQRIIRREGLYEYSSYSYLGDRITFIFPGGYIPPHTDKNELDGMIHVRFNVFIQTPEDCDTWYDGIRVDVRERGYVLCRSGIDLHRTVVNKTRVPRIAISYGFTIPAEKVAALYIYPPGEETFYRRTIWIRYLATTYRNIYNMLLFTITQQNPYAMYDAKVSFRKMLQDSLEQFYQSNDR